VTGIQPVDGNFMHRSGRFGPAALLIIVAAGVGHSRIGRARPMGIAAAGCDGCHNGGSTPTVTLTASPATAAIAQAVTLTITVSQTNGPVAGFFLTADGVNNGQFRAIEAGTFANAVGVTHTMPRTGSGGVTTFRVEWSSTMATGVQLSVYALSANGDGTNRGDAGGSTRLSFVSGCAGANYYLDQDGDGFGTIDPAYQVRKDCALPTGYAKETGDCNDFNETVFPGAPERCDAKDNNCDGKVDEAVVNQVYCEDKDSDGHGIIGAAMKTDCAPSVGFGDCNGDCDDRNKAVYPGAPEICDGRDNNCNGSVDEGVRMTCGEGWCRRYALGCTMMCTPGDPIPETCNYFDDDCDGVIDNGTNAQLCGEGGLVCVLGKCMASGVGGSSSGSGLGGGPGASGGSGLASGSNAAGGMANGGCSIASGRPETGPRAAGLTMGLLAIALAIRRRPRNSSRSRRP
jgi:MYXO-CTERM domain-containing protein